MVKEVLEKELKELEPKIQRARENNDFGCYKNLILAYKEVLNLSLSVKNKEIPESKNNSEIVGSHNVGNFIFQKRNDIIVMDCVNSYIITDDVLTLEMKIIDKDVLSNLRKNQFKGYILTHEDFIRNTSAIESSLLKKYKILSSNYNVKNIDRERTNYTLRFKIKPIK